MSGPSLKTVALVDPIWVGHHPMYFAQFAASFLRLGARVVAACPDPDDARRELVEIAGEEIVSDKVVFRRLNAAKRSFIGGRFEGDPFRTAMRWREVASMIRDVASEIGWSADMVYFPYLDTYLRFLPVPVVPELLLGIPWSGLYLRNHHHGDRDSLKQRLVLLGKGDALIRGKSCLGVGVLDERFVAPMEALTGKTVRPFPDFTNMVMPDSPTPLALEIREKAAGRKIVGIIGLERRKGILTMLRAAEMAAERKLPLYFVGGGRIFPSEYSEQEWKWIESLAGGRLPNLHLDLSAGRIPTEAGFNSLFSVFDIAWAAYEGFQGSSNTLAKAAAFGIPSLASDGGCVGARVKAYGTGLTIPEGDAGKALDAISRLAEDPPAGRYADFREQHSVARLDERLGELLARV